MTIDAGTGILGLTPAGIHYHVVDLAALIIMGGTGNNTFNIVSTAPRTPVTLITGGGSNAINLGSAANTLDSIQGAVSKRECSEPRWVERHQSGGSGSASTWRLGPND